MFLLFLKSPLCKYLCISLVLAFIGYSIYHAGELNIQTKWDIEKEKTKEEIAELKRKKDQVTIKIETKYVDRIKTVKEKGDTITEYVDRVIENQNCIIPKNFIVLHDRAATNLPLEGEKSK